MVDRVAKVRVTSPVIPSSCSYSVLEFRRPRGLVQEEVEVADVHLLPAGNQ